MRAPRVSRLRAVAQPCTSSSRRMNAGLIQNPGQLGAEGPGTTLGALVAVELIAPVREARRSSLYHDAESSSAQSDVGPPLYSRAMVRRAKQRELNFWTRGGRREGAGRPRSGRVSHDERPKFTRTTA